MQQKGKDPSFCYLITNISIPKIFSFYIKVCSSVKNTRNLIYLLNVKFNICYIIICLKFFRKAEMYYICTHLSSKETKIQFLKGYLKSRNAWPRGFRGVLEQIGSMRINTLILRQALKRNFWSAVCLT